MPLKMGATFYRHSLREQAFYLRQYVQWRVKNPTSPIGEFLAGKSDDYPSSSTFYRWIKEWRLNPLIEDTEDLDVEELEVWLVTDIENQIEDRKNLDAEIREARRQPMPLEKRRDNRSLSARIDRLERQVASLTDENEKLTKALAETDAKLNARIDAMHDFLVEIGVIPDPAEAA